MENKFEMMPGSSQPEEEVLEDEADAGVEAEEITPEEQEPKFEDEKAPDSEKDEEEMRKEEAEVAPEIEANFRDSLSLLHVRIQLRKSSEKEFPDKKELAELLENIPLFAELEQGAQKIFVTALDKEEDFRSDDEKKFVDKGMEVLDLFIHTAILKKGGDAWLAKKARGRSEEK